MNVLDLIKHTFIVSFKLPQEIFIFDKKKQKTVDSYTLKAEVYSAQQFLFVSL